MYNWTPLLYLSLAVATVMDDQPYCSVRYRRLCQGKGRHIACQFPIPGPGESCVNYTEIKFTDDLQSFITHYINRRRQRLAAGNERVRGGLRLPKPSVMMQVEWDRELAILAQRLADQCNFVHDDCRATVRYPYAGQTVGEVKWRRSSEPDQVTAQRAIRRVLDAWWGEKRRVLPEQLTAPFRITAKGNVWGHFSQLSVWSLRAFGCGAVRHGPSYQKLLLVCDYSHTNMLGQRTVSVGLLQPCPIHTARRPRSAYPLLCAPVRLNRINKQESYSPEEDYEYDDEETTVIETTTNQITKPTTKFINLTIKPATTTPVILTLPTTTTTLQTETTETESIDTTKLTTEVTEKEKFELNTEIEADVVHKDEEYDPLVHQGRPESEPYRHSTPGRFIDKLQHELDAGILHHDANQQRRYHALIPEKYHMWKQEPPYLRFRENAESMDQSTKIQTRGVRKFTAPLISTTKKIAPNRNNDGHDADNKNYEPVDKRIGSYDNENSLESPYNPYLASKVLYEKPLERQAFDFVETKDSYKPVQRKDPYEASIDAQRKKSVEKDAIRQRNEEIAFRPRADPMKRKEFQTWNQKKRVTVPNAQSQELWKDFEPPVQRKDVYEPVRQKWKHTRRRPVRPGAHALPLAMLASNANRPPERNSPVSLKMDRDDIDQLFKDTGYSPFLKPNKS